MVTILGAIFRRVTIICGHYMGRTVGGRGVMTSVSNEHIYSARWSKETNAHMEVKHGKRIANIWPLTSQGALSIHDGAK